MSKKNQLPKYCQRVVNDSTYVSINRKQLRDFTKEIEKQSVDVPTWEAPVFLDIEKSSFAEIVKYMLLGNSLNFCFTDLETRQKYTVRYDGFEFEGAFAMWASLHRAYTDGIPVFDPSWLKSVTETSVDKLLNKQAQVEIPFLQKRVNQLNLLGEMFEKLNVSKLFASPVQLYNQHSSGVVEKLASHQVYFDTQKYNTSEGAKLELSFDKRAQLAVCMLYGKLQKGSYNFTITDIDNFTLFADYGIPAYLQYRDILEYSDELQKQIENRELIEKGSDKEIEIRASTVLVGEQLKKETKKTVPELDYLLWRNRNETDIPHHLTETTAY